MLKDTYEKSKLIEKSGRKTASLSFFGKEGYGGRVAMEKSLSVMLILPARNIESGGFNGTSKIYFKKKQSFLPPHNYWIVVPPIWAVHDYLPGQSQCGPGYPRLG